MSNKFKVILVSILSLSAVLCSAQTDFEKGVKYFDLRAEKHQGLKVDSTNINIAIQYFDKALTTDNEKATAYLLRSLYYKASFVLADKKQQKSTWYLGKTIGQKAIEKYPKNSDILLWFIANYSKYGEAQGVVASAKNGLADKVKMYSERLLKLDPKFSDGAAYKLIGVINYKVPKIPLIISWPSKETAEKYLKNALEVNPKSISNLYYFAEFLAEEKRYTEAKIVLNKLLKTAPRKTHYIEDMYDISMAKKLKAKLK